MKPFIDSTCEISDLDELVYHSDPVIGGSLSSTGAKRLLKSPAHYKWTLDHGQAPKRAFDRGHIVHGLILGEGMVVQVLDFPNFLSKDAKTARDEARANGFVPVLAHEFEELQAAAGFVLDHPQIGPLFATHFHPDHQSEVSIFATLDGVQCRGRVDRVIRDGNKVSLIDVKTTRDADPHQFTTSAAKFDYALQMEFYKRIWREIHPGDDIEFLHVVVGLDQPYTATVVRLDWEFEHLGQQKVQRALDLFKECTEKNEWPGYPAGPHEISPPAWYAEADDEEMEF